MTPDHHTVIIGAGFGGIGTAIKLDKAGLSDYLIVEAGDGPGGTWYWNTYPGVAVDIPSFSYQFSFEQNPSWSRSYAPGQELRGYADHCVRKYRLADRIRYGTRVLRAEFNEEDNLWRLELASGDHLTARFLINACGLMTTPNVPDFNGLDDFTGPQCHTARWDSSIDLTGKRVGIIGTGASAVQVIAEVAPQVEHLTVFQRTPVWCFPKFDVEIPPAARRVMRLPGGKHLLRLASQSYVELLFPGVANYFAKLPIKGQAEKIGRSYLEKQVNDPITREKLTPKYAVGCKRPAFHNTYLSTFNRDSVDLVTDRIDKITPTGILAGGTEHEFDVLILATGFKMMGEDWITYELVGTGGQSLNQTFAKERQRAYEGVSVPGFPNHFLICGPYGYVGSSYFALIEAQSRHIVRCLTRARESRAACVEVRKEANDLYFAEMMEKRDRQVFWQDSCRNANSYYFDAHGDVPVRPGTTFGTYWRSKRFPLDDYRFSTAG